MSHLDDLLAGMVVTLSDDVLDRIDAIVPPGTDVGTLDQAYVPPAIKVPSPCDADTPTALRRLTSLGGRRDVTFEPRAREPPPRGALREERSPSGVRGCRTLHTAVPLALCTLVLSDPAGIC